MANDALNHGFCDSGDAAHRLSMQVDGSEFVMSSRRPMCPGPGALSLPGRSWSGAPVAGAGDCAASVFHLDLNFVEGWR